MSANLSMEKITFTTFCELFQLIDHKRPRGGSYRLCRFRFPIGEHHELSAIYSKSLDEAADQDRDVLGRPNTRAPPLHRCYNKYWIMLCE